MDNREADPVGRTKLRGVSLLREPNINKGQAFSIRERQLLGIHGLLAPSVTTQDDDPLERYIYLVGLQDRNEKLFYRVVIEKIDLMMPVIYTPTVGLACQKYGLIFRKPRGLFISIHDKGHVYDVMCNWPEDDIKAIVVTDGERILGLGDLGCYGMGIPVGKLSLYTACAGVKPPQCLPITLDVGTNNQALLEDPFYIGLRQTRIKGDEYDEFVEEFMKAAVKRYGQNVLIQFEDFGNANAFRLIEKYRDLYCTFNDDIQGTAAVAVAGLIACCRITKRKLSQMTYLFQGAGEAAIGIATLLALAMQEEGLDKEEAYERIWMVDSKGLIVQGRQGITTHKAPFAKKHPRMNDLGDVVKAVKPNAIIGVAAIAGAFTTQILKDMALFNERPIVLALSNPTSKAECTAEQAYTATEGRCIFASGSPFDPVQMGNVTYYPGQGNNAYIFPGLALAVILCAAYHISDDVFLCSAQTLASLVSEEDLAQGRVYPPLTEIREVSVKLAVKIVEFCYKDKSASFYPEPKDKEAFIRSYIYKTDYANFIPDFYDWPN